MSRVLVFDMDGVLVDVTESYREAIVRTVESFTGVPPGRERIQEFKNQGGWNNDWKLSHRFIADAGLDVDYDTVVKRFNEFFMGPDHDGLIVRERWIAGDGLLDRLAERWRLAIFTGRHRFELDSTLRRLGMTGRFDPIVTHETSRRPKPAPDGLLDIAACCGATELWYAGDTVDDATAAVAAGVPFVGICAGNPVVRECLLRAGAAAVIDDINRLESVLPE